MKTIKQSITVNIPVTQTYNQWTQFEEFPRFMEGVKEVKQLDDKRLHWKAEIAGKSEEWNAEIIEQKPDQLISWRSTTGAKNSGTIYFASQGANQTVVTLEVDYEPVGIIENLGDLVGLVSARVSGDLARFKEFIETRHSATGGWRGEIINPVETNERQHTNEEIPPCDDQLKKLYGLLKDFSTAMFITMTGPDCCHARPMAVARVDENTDVWLFTSRDSEKVREIEANSTAQVHFLDGWTKCVVISGRASVVEDRELIRKIWKPAFKVWFPGGAEDYRIVLLHIVGKQAEYWDGSGTNSFRYAYQSLKALVTATTPEIKEGEQHGKVNLLP